MATESEYQKRVEHYGWAELSNLWQSIQQNNTPDWADGKALEYLILRAFELEKAEVRYPYSVPMKTVSTKESEKDLEQIDGVVYVKGIACLIECKDYKDRINFEPIAKLRSQLMRRPSATIASIFGVNGFTDPAMMLLNFIYPQTILAWEADEIEYCLQHKSFSKGLIEKYRKAVEEGKYKHQIGVTP